MLLILDGLNELADAIAWRLCLEQIREEISERNLAVAVLCTSRKTFWKRCEPRKEKDQAQPVVVELEDFTDDELGIYDSDHGRLALALEELQSSGVLSPDPANSGHYKVNSQRMSVLRLSVYSSGGP